MKSESPWLRSRLPRRWVDGLGFASMMHTVAGFLWLLRGFVSYVKFDRRREHTTDFKRDRTAKQRSSMTLCYDEFWHAHVKCLCWPKSILQSAMNLAP